MRGPVSRVLSRTAIYLGRALPRASSHLHRDGRAGLVSLSTVLLRIEFTAPTCLQAMGGLLPPPFHPYHVVAKSAQLRLRALANGHARKLRSLPCSSPPVESQGFLRAEPRGGISLLHLSEGFPWRALPVILALWSPDFPHARAFAVYARPSGPLPNILPRAGVQVNTLSSPAAS